jgi:5-methylcytosine-specific restriction protein A
MSDMNRPSSSDRGYTWDWRKARARFLRQFPLCRMCEQIGRLVPATVVDHIIPHKGDQGLFWDAANWQPLCKPHHDSSKRLQEHGRGVPGCDVDGNPIDVTHRWNRP